MTIKILTLFPLMFDCLNSSILGKAQQSGLLNIQVYDIRDYSKDKHSKCDDTPFGGGAGMVMTPQPIVDAIRAVDPNHECKRIYLSPKGTTLCNDWAKKTAEQYKNLLLLCGHYEGVDQRALDMCIDEEISIGDYVLTGGELAAMVLVDSVSRFIPSVLGSDQSAHDESFSLSLLEYPQYTRPQNFEGHLVPDVLVSGHHENINKWRTEQSIKITKERRPDLLELRKEKRND